MFATVIALPPPRGGVTLGRPDQCAGGARCGCGCSASHLSALFRMMLANYLGRKGRETCLKAVVVFSAGWDVFECTASLEKPLDRFLFNSYLTSCLQASVHRSAPFPEQALARFLVQLRISSIGLVSSTVLVECPFWRRSLILLLPHRHRPVLEKCYDMDHVMKVGFLLR